MKASSIIKHFFGDKVDEEEPSTIRLVSHKDEPKTLKSMHSGTGISTVRFVITPELYERLVKRDQKLIKLTQLIALTFNQRVILTYRDKDVFTTKPK